MIFDNLIGNPLIKDYLGRMLKSGHFGNSLLFSGANGVGKGLFALEFAKGILCKDNPKLLSNFELEPHPDIHIYHPEGKVGMHSISSMRQLIEEIYLPPYTSSKKIFIIHDAERMLPDSSNALLKTFEEPTLDSLIILISSSPSLLLPTIRSRCQVLFFHPIEEESIESYLCKVHQLKHEDAKKIAKLARGSIAKAISLLDPDERKLEKIVLEILAGKRGVGYPALVRSLKEFQANLESKKKKWQQAAESINQDPQASPAQRELAQKESEGFVSLNVLREAETIFESILGWYRDMHLIQVGGMRKYLIHHEFQDALEVNTPRKLPELSEVIKKINEAKLAFSRSVPLSHALETFFLSLKLDQIL